MCHRVSYDEASGCLTTHVVSREDQTVRIQALNLEVRLEAGEMIQTENSYKYTIEQSQAMARDTGFDLQRTWYDTNRRFTKFATTSQIEFHDGVSTLDPTRDARQELGRRLLRAARGASTELAPLVHDASEDVLRALAANPELAEEDLLILLARRDLPVDLLRQVGNDSVRTDSYKVRLALLRNPRTPASLSLRFVPMLHTFDLVSICSIPHVPREVRAAADGVLLSKIKQMPLGVRVSLARRTTSEAVMGRLLLDAEPTVVQALLTNARLTEATLALALRNHHTPRHTVELIARSPRWSCRRDLRFALVRNRHTPLATALTLIPSLTRDELRSLGADPAVSPQLRAYLAKLGPARSAR